MRSAVLSLSVAALAASALVATAQAKMPKAKHPSHTGTFVSASADKLVMTGHNGKEHSHTVAKSVTVTVDGKPGQLAALKKGMQITVTTDASGTVTAISTPPAKPTTALPPASSKVPSVPGARK